MSFRDAEATDATLNGIAAILRVALEEPGYRRNPHQVYDNMDSDPLIGMLPEAGKPASRVELLQHMQNHRANPPVIPDEVVLFCRAKLQQGPLVPPADAATLGRVQGVRSLVNAVADATSGLSLRNAKALVRDVVGGPVDSAMKLAKQRAELAGKALSRYQMWCYPAADSRNPFREIGTTRAEAVNILGLGYYAYDAPAAEIVRWAHALPVAIQAYQPTAWDAGADKGNVHWRPGGRTYRLGRDDFGLSEVVHDRVTGENLVAPIETLS
jgi:hypothetical protein